MTVIKQILDNLATWIDPLIDLWFLAVSIMFDSLVISTLLIRFLAPAFGLDIDTVSFYFSVNFFMAFLTVVYMAILTISPKWFLCLHTFEWQMSLFFKIVIGTIFVLR